MSDQQQAKSDPAADDGTTKANFAGLATQGDHPTTSTPQPAQPGGLGPDVERFQHLDTPSGASRAPLPSGYTNRSLNSLPRSAEQTSAPNTANESGQAAEEDIPWGPAHPCFPHLNQHVPRNSPLYTSTRIVRIARDWLIAGDTAPTFSNLYPEILDPLLPEEQFRQVIQRLNRELTEIFNPWNLWNMFDGVMALLTFWLWEDLGFARVKRRLNEVEKWLEEWNRTYGEKQGVQIISLRRTAYMFLDIQIPDPQIGDLSVSTSAPPSRPATATGPGVWNGRLTPR